MNPNLREMLNVRSQPIHILFVENAFVRHAITKNIAQIH